MCTPTALSKGEISAEMMLVVDQTGKVLSGKLRPLLDGFAKEGWLQNLVVDEAHLIETWGAQFRVEFQLLAAAQREWRQKSGEKLRTFLFSATMSPRCRATLNDMFGSESGAREFAAQQIRRSDYRDVGVDAAVEQ